MQGAAVRGALTPAAAAALAFAALFLSNGSSQSRLFWIGAAAVIAAAVGWAVRPPTLSRRGLLFFGALAAFVLWQAASIAWSIQPSRSWDYANRGLVYLAFAAVGALLGGVSRRRLTYAAAALLGALFVWALAAKVIPGLYGDYGRLARLRYPLGYWNELALLAAASVPVGLWLVRRARLAGGLLLYVALVVVVLTYSRVGIVLCLLAALVWLALDEGRLESIGVLAVAWIVGAAVAGAGLLLPGIGDDGQAHHVRVEDGLLFGAALVVGAVLVALALRLVIMRAVDARVVRAAAVVLAALVLAALAGSVVRAGGPADWVRDRWHEFSNPVSAQLGNTPGRIASASSSNRWRWWQEAWNAFTDHPAQGTGAGTFELTDRIERNSPLAVVEPHSTPLQFLSELGLVGFLLYAAVLATAVLAIARRTALPLALAVGICFLHSFVDIDWDYVAVQGPLFLVVGALAAGPPAPRRGWLPAVAAGICALAAVYSLASPWLAQQRMNAALDSITSLNAVGARDQAGAAHSFNPLAVEPLWLMAVLTRDQTRALQLYEQARDLEPKNPETWYQLGEFELKTLKKPRAAYRDLNHAYTLDNFLFGKGTQPGRDLDFARCEVDPSTCPK
jgi:O-antigen ligase/polysaccharide polymerase Wzy-like membrane protein